MMRKRTTVVLENVGWSGRSSETIQEVLREVPGVLRASVNPATEAAYVEYDADRCDEAALETAVESLGVHALHRMPARRQAAIPFAPSSRRVAMPNNGTRSRTWWAFAGFVAIAGFFLVTEHRAHLFGILPFLFLLACPFLHMFGHGGHRGHANGTDGPARPPVESHHGHESRPGGYESSSDGHQHPSGVTPDDWRS